MSEDEYVPKQTEYVATYSGIHRITFPDLTSVTIELMKGDIVDLVSMALWLEKKRKDKKGPHRWLEE